MGKRPIGAMYTLYIPVQVSHT